MEMYIYIKFISSLKDLQGLLVLKIHWVDLPERIPLIGKVACARNLASENVSSSKTTKRRKARSGSST